MKFFSRLNIVSLCLLLSLGFIWGSGYSLARYATTHGVSPLGYAFWQSFGPACVVLFVTQVLGEGLPMSWKYLRFYFICGLIGIALPNTVMYFSAAKLPAGLLAVIVNTAPLLTYFFAFVFRLERFYWLRFCGILAGVAGIMALVLPKTALANVGATGWVLISLITPLCFALCAVYAAKCRPQASDSLALSAGMMICSAVLLFPVVGIHHDFYPLWAPFSTVDWVIILEIILSSLGYVLFFQLLKIAGPVYYSLVAGVVALTGLFWGWVIFAETLNRWSGLAVVLILIAIGLVSVGQFAMHKRD